MVLIASYILPTNSYAEDFIAVDVKNGKKLITNLQYCEESKVYNEKSVFALQSSLYQSELALIECEASEDLCDDIEKDAEEIAKILTEEVVFFKEKNSKCQQELVIHKKHKPFYKHWYFWLNIGWIL